MIRNRFTSTRFRNLQNLHVIPTASNIPLNMKPTPTESELPPVAAVQDISNKNVEEKMFNQNKPKNKFIKGRKSRNRRRRQIKHFALSQNEMENSNYDWYNPSYLNEAICSQPPSENIEEVESTLDVPIEEDFEEVEVASVDADGRQEILVGFRASKLQYLNYKKNCFFKPKIYKFGSERTLVNCLNVQDNCSVDVDIVSEAEYEIEYETENLDHGESQDEQIKTDKVNMKSIRGDQESTSNQRESPLLERNQMLENNNIEESSKRIYKTCIKDNADISQGQCLIQSSLDTWKSHLIGLEYIIEIRDKSSAKYYCVLCSEDLQFEGLPALNVINHINGCKHVVRYLEKHFPSYGFKFDENCDYNVVALQKICEEINEKLGYSSMCVTNLDYYEKNELKIKNIVQNASHFNDESFKLEKNTFQKAVVLDSLKDIQDVVDSIVEKILVSEENTMISESKLIKSIPIKSKKEVSHKASSKLKTDSPDKADKTSKQKESVSKYNSKSSKSFLKYRGNCSLSSYLKIKYAKARFKGLKTLKGLSSITKGPPTENIDAEEKKLIDCEVSNLQSTKSGEAVSDLINPTARQKVLGNKEKVLPKPTVHSKHCRKRILGRETTRLKVAAKASTKDEFNSGVLNKSKVKYVSVSEFGNLGSSKKITSDKDLKCNESTDISSHKSSPLRKVTSVPVQKISKQDLKIPKQDLKMSKQDSKISKEDSKISKEDSKISKQDSKISKQDSKSPFTKYSKSPHHRIVRKKDIESSKHEIDMMIRNSSSHWKPITRTSGSPLKSPVESSPPALKRETEKHSVSPSKRSPVRRTVRRQSKSPVRKIKSPLRLVLRSPVRKFSRSPVKRHSRSPFRRNSRSSVHKLSKSPLRRKSRSPYWRHPRSPFRKKSRSPIRRHSRSPLRRRSRSPLRRRSRSPLRRLSRSPLRRRSRSPLRRRSRSPMRRRSRSPVRRRSRSPMRRRSRSPWRRCSRSPMRRHSRSPVRRHSRSPLKRHRSPIRKQSRGSLSKSPAKEYRSIYKVLSPNIGHSGGDKDRIVSDKSYSRNVYNYDEPLDQRDREYTKVRPSKNLSSFGSNISDKQKSHTFSSGSVQGIGDLDPVSDEDESVYFDKQQRVEDNMTSSSSSSKMMLAQLFKKFSIPNMNQDDLSLNKLMQFMESHSAEIQELMGSQSVSKAGKINKVDSNMQERSLFLQQYLLSNLAGSSQDQGLSSLNVNMQPKYQQPPFLSENVHVGYGLVPNVAPHNLPQSNVPPHNLPQSNVPPHNLPQSNVPRFFPPNINVPPPEPYRPFNPPHQEFSPKPQVPPENMFKDLKATVNKLFGANEGAAKQEKNKSLMPGYVTVPDPEKWDLNHPDTPKFNAPTGPKFGGHIGPRFNAAIGQKNVFLSEGKSVGFSGAPESSVIRADMPIMYNNNNTAPGQFFSGRGIDRSQGQNVPIPPPDAKVSFCDVPRGSSKGNLFPVVHNVNSNFSSPNSRGGISDVKVSLAQRLASVLVKVGMTDVPAPLLQEMLMKIGAFSSLPRQDISEAEIISILKRLGYLS